MPNTIEHGQERVARVTASVAKTIMHGGQPAWETLVRSLWANDGSEFAAPTTGARAFGHEQEKFALAKFWERNPAMDITPTGFHAFKRRGRYPKNYRTLLGCSPDAKITAGGGLVLLGGGEIKSPTEYGTFVSYVADLARGNLPREHVDQVRFSLFVTGWTRWYFITHHGEKNYYDLVVYNNEPEQREWEARFRPRLDRFLDFYINGAAPKRDKLAVDSLAAMLGKK